MTGNQERRSGKRKNNCGPEGHDTPDSMNHYSREEIGLLKEEAEFILEGDSAAYN